MSTDCSASSHCRLPLSVSHVLDDDNYDAFLYVSSSLEEDVGLEVGIYEDLCLLKSINKSFESEITLTSINKKRAIYSPTGPLNRDYDDVRRIAEAAKAAVQKAIKSGSKRPLLINKVKCNFKMAREVAILGALEAAYVPLEIREAQKSAHLLKVEKLGVWRNENETESELEQTLKIVNAIELGRIVTRDIGGSDPERMAAANVLAYVTEALRSTSVKIDVIEGQENFEKDYPLFAAVNRAANTVPRHRGRIIKLEYSNDERPIDATLFLVGKGITYDTGGADVKAGGHMAGMHRDKCGAAFVAGFFKTLSLLKPKGIKVCGTMCMARNSIGEESYVADEIITARSKKRIRVGNTDAEGRMVMADPLCEAKERALNEINPYIFTIATLTGHVIRAYGPDYTAILGNGPAARAQVDRRIQSSGDLIGDLYEISTIRREDYEKIAGKSEYEDILQSTNNPSTMDSRGHQFPAAFLIKASGLDEHGTSSDKQLKYAHVDIAGSSGPFPGIPTGAPLPSFALHFILPRV